MYEVEVKFAVSSIFELKQQLKFFGCREFGCTVEEIDYFFQHPSKDFVQSDECLRVRRRILPEGQIESFLTYKGPKIDTQTKTRKEIETSITNTDTIESIFEALGFHKVAEVRKFRQRTVVGIEGREVEITLDTLPDLPEDRCTFAELEILAPEFEFEKAKAILLNLANELGLTDSVRSSYLRLITEASGS